MFEIEVAEIIYKMCCVVVCVRTVYLNAGVI